MELSDFQKYKSSDPTSKPNKLLIPVNNFSFNEAGVAEFNEIYRYCIQHESNGDLGRFKVTRSYGISISHGNLHGALWNISYTSSLIEIILRNFDARYYRFIISNSNDDQVDKPEKEQKLSGRQAFILYKEELQRHGVNLEDFAIENGKEVKMTIPAPRIELCCIPDRTYINAHHIDLNASYNSGMMEAFPELGPAIRAMYQKRQFMKEYKQVLNMTQGFMQSALTGYRFAHISKAGYEYTLRRLDELTKKLNSNGFSAMCYNTDGIWYQSADGSNRRYTDDNEGPDLGQWKHDYVDCKIRFKSKGCYEFIGTNTKDGISKYHPVFRGTSSYERIKPRILWEWGDIYKGDALGYRFVEGEGLFKYDIL